VDGPAVKQFGTKHLEILERFAIGKIEGMSSEESLIGFLGGQHLFDQTFTQAKNVVNESLHCALRIDTNKIPAALKRAWLAMELAPLLDENDGKRVNKAQRQQAVEAVEARCEEEAASGKFKLMQQFPALWDGREGMLYLGSSSSVAVELGCELFEQAFKLDLEHIGAGKLAQQWAKQAKKLGALDKAEPTVFHAKEPGAHAIWLSTDEANFDFLGNEFLLWLWWTLETQSDTLKLADGSEVTAMLTRTLSLECPRGDSGKETITSESPVRLPEALHALKFGKLPRRSGLMLVRHGMHYDFVLQAETFGVSGGRIKFPEEEDMGAIEPLRVDGLRGLVETLDLTYGAFLERRVGSGWDADVKQIRRWLSRDPAKEKKPAA